MEKTTPSVEQIIKQTLDRFAENYKAAMDNDQRKSTDYHTNTFLQSMQSEIEDTEHDNKYFLDYYNSIKN